ncbi:hypothetical protein JCM30566_17100 [Marinitoga arctica]
MDENKLFNLKIIKKYNNKIYLTIGGALILGLREQFEYSGIKCARFKGNNINEFIDSKEFTGPLYKIVEDAINFAKIYIERNVIIKGLAREEKYIVPIEVLREVIVNAVVHRDYSINSDIKFAIFDNRIEVTSPGGLPGNLNVETIKDGRSEIRNKVIARFFKEIGYIEQWGTGIRRIIELCSKNGLKKPEFIDDGRYFKVVIYKIIENRDAFIKVLDFILKNGKIKRKDIEKIFNVGERRARNILKEYVEKSIEKMWVR